MKRRGAAAALAAAVVGTALVSGCSGKDAGVRTLPKSPSQSDGQGRSPTPVTTDCGDPDMPMGEWRKRCASATPTPTGGGTRTAPTATATFGLPTAIPSATTPTTAPTRTTTAKIGDTIGLSGYSGEVFDATLVQVVDPATPKDPTFSTPKAGNRLIAMQWRVTNTGTVVVTTVPSFATKLVDDQGQVFELTIGARATGVEFPSSVQIPSGESRLGFVTYEVPKTARIVKVEFEAGYGRPAGQWSLV